MEHLLLVNPRRRKRRSKGRRRMPAALRRYWASKRSRTRLTNPRRRRRHRHARRHVSVSVNPRRRRRARHHYMNPRRRRRGGGGGGGLGFSVKSPQAILHSAVIPAAIGGAGALALDVTMGYVSPYLPATLQAGWFNLAVRLAGAIGLGMVAGKFLGRERGRIVMLGALTVAAYSTLKGLASSAGLSLPGLSGYADYTAYPLSPRMGAYMKGPTNTPGIQGLGYVSPAPVLKGLGAYMRAPMNVAPAMGDYGDGM